MDVYLIESKESDRDTRLDIFISKSVNGFSRSYIKKLIDSGKVKVNGIDKKPNYLLKGRENIKVEIPKPIPIDIKPEDIFLDIIYEDDYMLIVNKPQGMVVHPAYGNYEGTLVNALLHYCDSLSRMNDDLRPGIVHRLDKDTSGLLMVAKTNQAHIGLLNQMISNSIAREYIALVEGKVKLQSGTIDAPIGRHPNNRKKMAVVSRNGKKAMTHYTVLERFCNNTLIEARLVTGRTHQIRVHMSYIGYPIVGDLTYGYKKQRFNLSGQLLHANTIKLNHPITGERMIFKAPSPAYFDEILRCLRTGV